MGPLARPRPLALLAVVLLALAAVDVARAQPLRPLEPSPTCIQRCLKNNKGCRDCVRQLSERLSTPAHMDMPFHKAHPGLPDPVIGVDHHDFLDRPPWVAGSMPAPHPVLKQADGKVHVNCPAMKARSGISGITIRMPYTVRFFRAGAIEFECHWIKGNPTHRQELDHPVDSPWMRLPQSHLQMFTVGDSRADVWIVNSGIYVEDREYMSSPNAKPNAKGTSTGNKWMVLPIPHKLEPQPRGWHIEQGIMSSFQRTSRNANIPLQLNFTTLPPGAEYIEIKKGTPMMQYVPAVLPTLSLHEEPMPKPLADYLVLLSDMHNGGDHRVLKGRDKGAYDVMRSYQLKDNPGYKQSHRPNKREL